MGGILDAELFGTAIRQATPLILAALGGLLSERVGVVNIGLEGKILMGAFAAALGTLLSGSLWVGLAAAVLVGLALALIHAVATQEWRTDHIVSGVAINLLALGLSTYLFRQLIVPREEAGESSVVPTFGAVSLGGLENLPLLNALLKDQSWLTLFALGLPFVLLMLLTRTRWGLRVYAVGNDSQKARMMGVPVKRMRYLGVLLSGALAGLAGAFLVLAATGQFRVADTGSVAAGSGCRAVAERVRAEGGDARYGYHNRAACTARNGQWRPCCA